MWFSRTLTVTTFGVLSAFPAVAQDERPNILLVMVDDMGWTDIGSYGGETDTSNLDALAKEGVLFTDFRVSVSCSPTRSMLMSGTDNHLAGLGNMGEMLTPERRGKPGYEGYLNDHVATLAEIMRDGGYPTTPTAWVGALPVPVHLICSRGPLRKAVFAARC